MFNVMEKMFKIGCLVVVVNYLIGLVDGVVVWDVLCWVWWDIVFFVNVDVLWVNFGFFDVLILVEWVMDKCLFVKICEMLCLVKEVFVDEKCVVIFFFGKFVKKIDGVLIE